MKKSLRWAFLLGCAMAGAAQEFGAVMMVNLDHFQKLNDSLGHAAGDRLLVEMARRIRPSTSK